MNIANEQSWQSKTEVAEKTVESPPLTFDDICKPLISTKGWKFNRDEANER